MNHVIAILRSKVFSTQSPVRYGRCTATYDKSKGGYETLQHRHNCRFEGSSKNSLKCEVELVRRGRHRVEMVAKSCEVEFHR